MEKSRKIIILNGSPRRKGNTSALVQSFTEGAEQSGNIVTTFFIDKMNIRPCKGCYGGGKDPNSPCVQKDDMDQIYPVYEKADVVVFASPMYFWSITGQLKCALDRLFAVSEKIGDYQALGKDCVMLMAAEGNDKENSEPVEHYYKSFLNHMKWNNKGLIIAGGVVNMGDIKGHPALAEAHALGVSL